MLIRLPGWLQELRESEIVRAVRSDPRSIGGKYLGVSAAEAMRAVGWGQADFDSPWGRLSCDDRAVLYAYFLQLGHLEELIAAFRQMFDTPIRPENPIVIDLGCGPFTGGLAIASELGRNNPFDYIGVDQSRTICKLGEKLASAAEGYRETPTTCRQWATDIDSVCWHSASGWRPVIVVMSYLLASPTLNVEQLVLKLSGLLDSLSGGRVTVLYTNSSDPSANEHFGQLRDSLSAEGFTLIKQSTGRITIQREGREKLRPLRYALFARQEQGSLPLGTN